MTANYLRPFTQVGISGLSRLLSYILEIASPTASVIANEVKQSRQRSVRNDN